MIFYHICYPFSILLSIPLYLCMYITECVRLYASYNASSYSIPILSISDTTSFSLFSPLFSLSLCPILFIFSFSLSLSLCLFLFIFPLPLFHLSLFIYFYSFLSLSLFVGLFRVSGDHNLLSLVKTRLEPSWTSDKRLYLECVIIGTFTASLLLILFTLYFFFSEILITFFYRFFIYNLLHSNIC